MSLPILLGSKSVSSRPLIASITSSNDSSSNYREEQDHVADDGMTPLDPVPVPGPVLTATAVCPLQEWLAFVTISYFDMMMAVVEDEDDDDDQEDSASDSDDDEPKNEQTSLLSSPAISSGRRRRRLARHSTVAQVQIQISPLALPYSSAYRTVTHRLTLPHSSPASTTSFLDDRHLEGISRQPTSVQPCLVFSSDRQSLACLLPYPRSHHHHRGGSISAVVAFALERPTQQFAPPKLPKLPSYIPTSSSQSSSSTHPKILPQALQDPEWLQLPSNATTNNPGGEAYQWLHTITALCNASTTSQHPFKQQHTRHKGSSVLLAGCRDGSILGISFHPLLLAGRLYRPTTQDATVAATEKMHRGASITFLSHITTTTSPNNRDATTRGVVEANPERDVLGKLVALQESGRAIIFQTRMVLSSLTQDGNHLYSSSADLHHNHNHNESTSHFLFDDSTSALYHDMDATDASEHFAAGDGVAATGVVMIHGQSFQVVQKTGRRNSLPANTRFATGDEAEPLLRPLLQRPAVTNHHSPVVGNTGLLMFVEPISDCPGNICRAQWITGTLLAVLEQPTINSTKRRTTNGTQNRVAQVLGIVPGRPPEALTELTLTTEDLNENAHTRFALSEDSDNSETGVTDETCLVVPGKDVASLLESTFGLQYDAYSGCLAICSARLSSNPSTPPQNINGNNSKQPNSLMVRVFVSLWHWRSNTSGFTAVSTTSLDSCHRCRPTSQLFLARERLTSRRRLVHLHSVFGKLGCDRLRKDLYEVGFLSPPHDVRRNSALDGMETSPLLLTSSSVTFPLVSQPASHTSEIEWQEADIPINYRLDYGCPIIAAMSTGGRSIAVASSRGLCVLECSPRPKKCSVANDRTFMFEASTPSTLNNEPQSYSCRHSLPPKWHLFGNETEEKAFRVLTMAWWQGHQMAKRHHVSDDLLCAVVQLQRNDAGSGDPAGTCYLACWSQRRLDTAHQRLRPLDPNLQSSRCQWGVRLPGDFRTKSLNLLAQPNPGAAASEGKHRGRKALVMLTSTEDSVGLTKYILYQLQVIPSVGRTQSSDSYVEHRPYSVLSKQASAGEIKTGDDTSGSTVLLASASFQFDLRHRWKFGSNESASSTGEKVNEIVGTVGIIKSPGCGLDAVVLTSIGPSRIAAVIDSQDKGNAKRPLKSSEISSYWLSDFIHAQRSILTTYGESALMDFYAWTFQRADGKVLTWFVPCLEFEPRNGILSPNVFSSRTMLGLVCPNGTASTWLQRSPAKTGKDFMVGCVPHSPHGCVLSTGQASRKFHRTIAGGFDHSLFAADFMEHEFLYARDLELSPPAFMSSTAALAKSSSFLLVLNLNNTAGSASNSLSIINPGGEDVEKALLAVDMSEHVRTRAKPHQDAAFMALRLLVLRSVEQLSDDVRKSNTASDMPSILSSSVLAEVLHIVRSCSRTRLQFTSLILEVGRQLEPSCFPQLFPLPAITPSVMVKGRISAADLTTVADFFDACMEDGSLLSSVSSLPIISARDLSRQKCILLLEHCLEGFKENIKSENDCFFDVSMEERSALGDIFRFGAKLEDTNNEDFLDFPLDHDLDDVSIDSSTASSGSDADDDDYTSRKRGHSLACGIFNMSWFSRKAPPPKQKAKTATGKTHSVGNTFKENNDNLQIKNIAESVAKVLVPMTVSGENEPHLRNNGWKRSAALASMVVGQGESTLPRLSAKECMTLFKQAGGRQSEPLEEGITSLLTRCMIACSAEISPRSAGKILDLVLILLARAKSSSDFDSFLPGLLVIGITTGYASNTLNEILDVDDKSTSFTRCYWRAKEKADSFYIAPDST